MGTTSLSSLGIRDILIREGIHPPVTMRDNGGAVFPGYVVTGTADTYPDVSKADALADNAFGVAGLLENQDIDTVYTDNEEIPVYLCGSGAIVYCYHSPSGGAIKYGDILVAKTTVGGGHVQVISQAIKDSIAAGDTNFGTVFATQITNLYSLVGRAMETSASSGTTVPIKVLLSI